MSVEDVIGYVDNGKEAAGAARECAVEAKAGLGAISVASVVEAINTLQAQLQHLLEGEGQGTLASIVGLSEQSRAYAKTAVQQYSCATSPGGNPLIHQARHEITNADTRAQRLSGFISHQAQATHGALASLENAKAFLNTFHDRQEAAALMADGVVSSCEASVVRADAYITVIAGQ